MLDRRLHAFRPDLADETLRGQVEADRFTTGEPRVVCVGAAALRPAPDPGRGLDTQLLYGERVTCFDEREDWAWVQSRRDGYVGYVRASALGPPCGAPTHQVRALRTFLYAAPDLKASVRDALSMTSLVRAVGTRGLFCEVAGGGWVYAGHLERVEDVRADPVETALRFEGLPYRWGGKESVGLDCSGLVQVAVHAAGRDCPRDSDMQARGLGVAVDPGTEPRRGDLLCMPGHVAIALGDGRVVHATAHTMTVCSEPLADLLARVRGEHGCGLTALRRLPPPA